MSSSTPSARRWLFRQLVVIVLIVISLTTVASAGTSWEQLSKSEQAVLAPHQPTWSRLSEPKRKVLLRWARLTPSERQSIRERRRQWLAIPAARQRKIIIKLQRYKRMPVEERIRAKRWWRWVQQLPEQERRRLHQQWPRMSDAQRNRYIQQLEKKYGQY